MSKEPDVRSGEEEFKTAGSGIDAVQAVLTGQDIHAKERLLFYLDWFMDPYYGKDLSATGDQLKELLQNIAVTDQDAGIVEEALHLPEAYTEGPCPILEKTSMMFRKNTDLRSCIC